MTCYDRCMRNHPAFIFVCAVFVASCKGEAPESACQGAADHSLQPLEPCLRDSEQCVEGSHCDEVSGLCSLSCEVNTDCREGGRFGDGTPGQGDLCLKQEDGTRICAYNCGGGPCPTWLEGVTCEANVCKVPEEVCE